MGKAQTTITIGSKLPAGLVLNHPQNPHEKVTLRGLNSAPKGVNKQPIIVPFMTTEVDTDFWAAWKFAHEHPTKPFKPLASGAIFECGTQDRAEKTYREREREKTGFESLSHTAEGVQPATAG